MCVGGRGYMLRYVNLNIIVEGITERGWYVHVSSMGGIMYDTMWIFIE